MDTAALAESQNAFFAEGSASHRQGQRTDGCTFYIGIKPDGMCQSRKDIETLGHFRGITQNTYLLLFVGKKNN